MLGPQEYVCTNNCPLNLIGPPELDGTPCPACGDGELATVGPAPLKDTLESNGWAEAPDVVFSHEVSFESFECTDERRSIIRENEAHMLQAIRQDAAPSFITGGRP